MEARGRTSPASSAAGPSPFASSAQAVAVAANAVGLGSVVMFLPGMWRWVGLGAAVVLMGVVAAHDARRRRSRLERLRAQVGELLTFQPGAPRVAAQAAFERDDPEGSLAELGARVRGQINESAKASRNLMALIDGLDMPVIATGNDESVLLCNRAAEDLVGLASGAMKGRRLRELFTRRELLELHDAARGGETRRGELRLNTPAGPRTFQVSATPLPAAWGEGVFGAILVLRDVTELAQAMAVKTDFVASASHELRTPVAALRAALETLRDGADEDPAMRGRLLAMCERHAARLEEMTGDLLDLSRLESPEAPVTLEAVDVAEITGTVIESIERTGVLGTRRLTVRAHVDEVLGPKGAVTSDRRLLDLILRNLLENATKFAYEGTTIEVRWRAARIGASEEPAGGTLRLEVQDRGPGIPLEQQERVFERFYQVDPARTGFSAARGSGLGLAIVKHAARVLGGEVGLTSVWGEGTTVWAEVPRGEIGEK